MELRIIRQWTYLQSISPSSTLTLYTHDFEYGSRIASSEPSYCAKIYCSEYVVEYVENEFLLQQMADTIGLCLAVHNIR